VSNNLAQLTIEIAANLARFENDMRKANATANQTMQRMAGDVSRGTDAIQNSLSMVGKSIVAGFSVGAVIAFTKEIAQAGIQAEKLQMQFKAVAGSNAAAAREMSYIRNVSNQLGLDFQTSATAYAKFLASTRNTSIEGDSARKVFEGVSKAVTAMGLSAEESNGIFLALSQMMSKGKVSAEELNGQLGERLPGALKLAADGMGITTAELMKQMQEGKIMSADLLPKLAAELEKTYGKAAEEAARKGQAGINRFNNEVRSTAQAIGQHMLPAINAAANAAASLLHSLGDMGETSKVINDKFALPEDRSIALKNSTLDPQMARIEAERRGTQEVINLRRAAAEKAAALKGDAEKATKAAEAAAESQRLAYNQGVQAFNRLVDAFNQGSPSISTTEKAIAKVREEVAQLSKEHPEQAADAARVGKKIEEQLRLADALKVQTAELREQIKLYEEVNGAFMGPAAYAQGMGGNWLSVQSAGGSLGKDGAVSGGMPGFSLLGAPETGGFGGHGTSALVEAAKREADERLLIEDRLNKSLLASKMQFAEQSLHILELSAKQGSAIAIGAAIAQKGLAVAQIIINTNAAASAALLAPPVGLGPIAGAPLAAEIKAMGYMNAAMTGAVGIMEVAGKRAMGGPVRAGETYLVGERGPELMTVGASGFVTPNSALGGGSVVFNNSYDFRGADEGTIMRLRAEIQQRDEMVKADIFASMNRGGSFAVASGRR